MSEIVLKYFASFIEKELGIIYSDTNFFQLQNRLDEVVKQFDYNSLQELMKAAESGLPLKQKQFLLDLATNNETSFFRDSRVFNALKVLFGDYIDKHDISTPIRIWSAAASTGQEPISLAITMLETIDKKHSRARFNILGTDICDRALDICRKFEYSAFEISRGLDPLFRDRYFEMQENDRYRLKDMIRSFIRYERQNLLHDFTGHDLYHFIFCRNVLIYQTVESKKNIIKKMAKQLYPGGYLVLGSGESLHGLSDQFEQLMIEGAVIYRKN